ncbi:MAG: amidohydrolase [Desulfobulbus sp.]|nr:amidohydrolase [Desulfobulbus sp.]
MGTARIIDSHIHCGVQHSDLPFERITPLLRQAGITDACLFAPVEDVYDRDDFHFQDNDQWQQTRRAANRYLLDLAGQGESVFPYLFVWNDFAIDELRHPYRGIKWHRHSYEPEYQYDDPRCAAMLDAITRRRLPVVLEESYANTLRFADLALASAVDLRHFVEHYGPGKLLFGSDFPFGTPAHELRKIRQLNLSAADFDQVVCGNILRLLPAVSDPCMSGGVGPGQRIFF